MPEESSTTFSTGLESTNDTSLISTALPVPSSPLFEFGPASATIGASQNSPRIGASTFAPQTQSQDSSLEQAGSLPIPKKATIPPRLKLAGIGRSPRLKTRQLWEGTVTQILDNGFVAVLSDKTNSISPEEQATFQFESTEISPEDRRLISPGASFYWIIGSERTRAGQIKNVSMLQFRLLPLWT